MTHSESLNELATALAKAQGAIAGATKDKINPHFKSAYADLASVWDACRQPLTAHGLAIVQLVSAIGADVTVETLLTHTSGQWICGQLTMTAQQNTPQGLGSCITYARRYALSAMVGVAPEDDDGEAASKPNGRIPAALVSMRAQQDVPAPTGYAAWVATLDGVADEGTDALKKAWNKSKPEYRAHLTKTDMATWERLKEQAGEIDLRRVEANA